MPAAPIPIPAPYGGMNTRDGLAVLQPTEARYLENWQPEGNSVTLRPGYKINSAGGQSGVGVGTLSAYDGASGRAIIGVNAGRVFDFTNATAVELYDGMYASDVFQTECYSGYLIGVNGQDTPWSYNGTSVSATGLYGSGLTITNLVNVAKARTRLWYCEKDSADVWYGGLGAVTGSLTKFQLSQVAAGGYCMAIGAHSQDAGAGPDDYTVFVMSTGEVILYSGDPASTFSKVGNYHMPPPVGRQCIVNIGGPLAVLTIAGVIPLQAAVNGIAFDPLAIGNWGKLGPTLAADVASYKSNSGWHAIEHAGRVIVNVPTSSTTSKQRVYNYLTGTWTTWTGHNSGAFCVSEGELYYGPPTNGEVRHVTGTNDDGNPIAVKARQAFILPNGGVGATASAMRFDISIDGTLTGQFGIDVDYGEKDISGYASRTIASASGTTPWGSDWGSDWSSTNHYPGKWKSVYGQGRTFAPVMEATAAVSSLDWFGSQVMGQTSQAIL